MSVFELIDIIVLFSSYSDNSEGNEDSIEDRWLTKLFSIRALVYNTAKIYCHFYNIVYDTLVITLLV